MKHFTKFLSVIAIMLFTIGVGNILGTTYSHTIGVKTWSAYGAQTLNGVSWTASATGGAFWGYDATKGQQFGSSGSPAKPLSLTTSDISGTITSVKVTTSGATSVAATLSVSVGGTSFTPATTSISATNTAYTFTGSASGAIVITWAQTSSKALYLKALEVTYSAASVPTITVTPTTLSGFTYVQGSGPSATQPFTVSGANLTANISLAAPTNYEISLSSGSGYAASLTLTQSGGTVSSTTIYARLKSGLSTGTYNSENITATSTGATNQTVSCSGSVTAPVYTVTPSTNNASYGSVSVLDNVITATPAAGYGYASPAYTVTSGGATVSQSGNDFTVTPSSNCAVRINFEALPTYTLSLSNDGSTYAAGVFPLTTYAGNSTTLPTLSDCSGYTFVGWDTNSATTSTPTYAPGATYTTTAANVTLYAVYSITTGEGSTPATTSIAFSTVNNGWTKGLSQTDGSDYWKLFLSADYFLSPSIDLSTITAVSAKIGTFGGGTHTLSVQDESGNVWGTASVAIDTEITTSVPKTGSLSGTGKVKFVCTTGSSTKGLRVQDITIDYAESSSTTTYTTLPGCCTAHNTSFTNATVTKTDNDAAFTNALINNVNTSTKAFTSSDPTVATVNATSGLVTIIKAGTTTINLKQAKDATYCAVDISYALTVTNQIKNAWLQWPTNGTVKQGLNYTVFGKVTEPGVTDADGNGAVITAWIGYSTTDNDPSGTGWTWVAAPFDERQVNDYQYKVDLGAVVTTPGTYYYAARFQIGTAPYVYGGYGTGYTFWNGTTSVNQQLVVTTAAVNWANVQWPASGSCTTGGTFDVYAQVYEAGITNAVGQGAGIQVWIGRSTSNATNPNTWAESAWVLASYTSDEGNNDQYKANIATGLTPGTYYYASRIQLGAGAYQYGGYNGGFWNGYFGGSGNLNGKLVVNNATVAWCNLQSPATGSIFPNSEFNVYARVYEDGVTNVAGAGDNLTVWIGYSSTNTDPSSAGWTWVEAAYTQDYGNNDEFVANIGATLGEGTYYYASRVQLGLGDYKYGGYSAGGGGFWDGSAYKSGELTVAQPKYTVTFDVGTGTAVPSIQQASYGASITLPTAEAGSCATSPYNWTFAGWSETALVETETTTAPTLLAAGSYTPAANKTLYAVYKKTTSGGASDVTFNVATIAAAESWTNTTQYSSYTISPITITYAGGVNDGKYYSSDQTWRSYKDGGSVTITSSGGDISAVVTDPLITFTVQGDKSWKFEPKETTSYKSFLVSVASSTTTYHSTPFCIACDASSLAVTSPQTINLDAAGLAELDISTLVTSNSNAAFTYALTPTSANADVDAATGDFLADAVGTYTVTISQAYGTETPTPHCPASVTLTITVLATPVVTIVDVTPLTFTANCGEPSVAQSVSVTGYNLTANMTATAPTNFLVSNALAGTYAATATFTQTGGAASGTLYIKANPPQASTTPISGNVTLTSTDATTRTLAVSATVSCTPVHVYFNDKGSVIADSTEYVGGTVTFPANPSCTDANYTFDGWYTNTLNDAASYTKVTAPYTVTAETTLYAVYKNKASLSNNYQKITLESDLEANVNYLIVGNSSSSYNALKNTETTTAKIDVQSVTPSSNIITTTDGAIIWKLQGSADSWKWYNAAANVYCAIGSGATANLVASTTDVYAVSVGSSSFNFTSNGKSLSYYHNGLIFNAFTSANTVYVYKQVAGTFTTNPLCCPNQLATPTNFAATPGNNQVSLSWDAVANASGYNIECTTNPAKSVIGATNPDTITGLTNCTAYSFKITAIGDNSTYCQSVASTAVTATPQSAVLTATFNAGTNGTCGTASLTNTCLSNDITLPSATPNVGFAFDGWQVDGTGTVYLGGSTFTLSANVTLVAKYHVLATYSISFINEGIEIDSLQQIVSEGSAGTEPVETMLSSCSEYLFKGWSTTQISGSLTSAPTYYDFATAVTGPVTLYAVYSFVNTSNGGFNDYTLVKDKADLTAGSKVIITYGSYVMGAQTSDYRTALASGETAWTKTGDVITLAATSTAAVLTVGIDGTYYTFNDGAGYLYAASTSSSGLLRTQSALDAKGKWTLGTIGVDGKCDEVKSQTTESRSKMLFNTLSPRFSCYSSGTGYMIFYKNTASAEYTTNPICSPMIVVDQTDVENSIDSTDFVIGLGGTATSTGHTVFAKNCTSASYVQPVIFGVDKAVFSVNWTRVYLDNGAMDSVYTVSYSPVTGTSHNASLYFETDDHTVISDTIPLYGEMCTAVVFGSQSATENTITINWTAPSEGSKLRVWNTITMSNACTSAPQPFDQTYVLGTEETTKTVTGLKASATYYYQATTGTCVSEQRTITTPAASGVPALTASSSTIEFVREIGKDTTQSVSLSGVYMNNASVSVAITGAGAAAFTTNASIKLDATGKGTLSVTYHPTSSQTFVAVATITYTSGCETKTVVVNLVGNVPGIDMVEINGDATGFVIHTDFQGTPDIVLSQEVEHAGSGKVANDLFFSKYYEAYSQVKLVGIYNGTRNPISLESVRVVQKKAGTWSSASPGEIIPLDILGQIEPGKEIILYSSGGDGADTEIMSCVKDGIGFDHEGWYPVGTTAATKSGQPNLFSGKVISFGGDKSIALQRQRTDESWAFLDLIGAGDSLTSNNDACVKILTNNLNDNPGGWYCADGVNYKTKEPAPLSTNRHLLIRKNTVVDGLNAVLKDTANFVTLCEEWEGLNVPYNILDRSFENAKSCEHFSAVAEFNYDGYYSSFERVKEGLVTFDPVPTAPGDWVGKFPNAIETFQDTLRCYNLQISVLRYYDMRTPATPVELTKAQVQGYQFDALSGDPDAQAIIAALDTVEAASTQWRVPIIVKNSATVYTDDVDLFRDLSVDTCKTCDVVILNGGTLIKTTKTVNDRDSVRSVIVYNGGRLIVPNGLNYVVNDLQVRAKGDSVGAAFIQGNLMMKNPRVVHDKRVKNDKAYFFTLPYDCPISRITQMNGKTMGPYGSTWVIKTYDGAQRIQNRGLSSNWKVVDAGATLKAGVGYALYISSDIYKYVRFPMVADATFTEKNTAKSMDVTQYGHAQAYGTDGTDGTLGWNNVGWNLVGNPYVSYFMAQGAADSIMTGTTILKGRYLPNGGYNENTWKLDDTENVYITVPDAVADGGYLQKRVSLTQLDPFISFFVQADRTGSLNFATSSRESVAKVMRAPVVDYNEVVVNFDVAGKSDKTTIILDKERNTSYEIGQDLLKWKGKWGKTPYLYSFDNANNPLAFNAINYDEAKGSVPVAFYMPTSYARYTFSIDRSASKLQGIEHVYLLRNGSVMADLLTTDYTATDLKLKAENKEFAISIQRAAEVVTPVNPTEDDLMMPRVITERHEVRVEQLPAEGTVMVMDAVGRTIATRTLTGADNVTFELPVDGVYTITVMTPARNYTLKTVIR